MTPKNATAQEKAIEALIAASLRAPHKETKVTQEEINRYADQNVTLSQEDNAALEESKPGTMQAIRSILLGNGQENQAPTARPSNAGRAEHSTGATQRRAPNEFVEAVLIAQLTRLIATPQFPLGHFRQNKMIYLAHRVNGDDVGEFYLKQPAGPYSSRAKYQGPEGIAQSQRYVRRSGAGFIVGDKIDKIDQYVPRYPICAALDWVVAKFRYRKNDELELLTTVDFAALELIQNRSTVTMEGVKKIIATSTKWAAKLDREIFSDENISAALAELRQLFPKTYA